MMKQSKKEELKKRLIQELERLKKQQNSNQRLGLEKGVQPSTGELSSYDNHPADLGTEMFEREKDLAFSDVIKRQMKEIESALKRMENGNYGICRVCKQPIPEERLDAKPWADTCVSHHQHSKISKHRPIEEEVIQPFRRSQDSGYDQMDAWKDVEKYGTSNPPDFFRDAENYNECTIDDDENREGSDLTEGYSVVDLGGDMEEV